jgi:ADP-ribosyl-[dinitrogen reductase] hydrolase
MSLAIARVVLLRGQWELKLVADSFVAWMKSKPIDIGSTVRKGIRHYMKSGELAVPYNEWDAGNGAAMRMAPIALFTLGDERELKRYALEQARLTHHHVLSDAACLCVGRMVQAAIQGAEKESLRELASTLVIKYPTFQFNNYRGQASGYVVDTMQTVFHYLFTTDCFEDCLVGVVNQGGDADTTGAIAGMIAGAFYGPEQLPRQWLKKLDKQVREEIEYLSPRLLRLSPWARQKAVTAYTEQRGAEMEKRIELISMEDTAQRLNTTPLNVLMHIKRGLLKGQECDGTWFVLSDSMERYVAENGGGKSRGVCRHKGCSCSSACG